MTKMTMFIDEELLARVMELTASKTKTDAVDFALREAERRGKIVRFAATSTIATDEWRSALDPAYDLDSLRAAEKPAVYAKKRGSR
jgi:Arc/MetJ family transcription regulator